MKHTVTLIPGDGVGPEVIAAARRVLEATGVEFQWQVINAGEESLDAAGPVGPTWSRLSLSFKSARTAGSI